ncbi:MAG: hypothetical protein LBL83_01930 [Clostridiales bacterium]|jgi:hypothetical protein|nr:hypothetical protein [Clostridiales bacterium]
MATKYEFPERARCGYQKLLPNPFIKADGSVVASAEEWPEQREYLKAMLEFYMYGRTPPGPYGTVGEVVESRRIHDGAGIEETVKITCGAAAPVSFELTVRRPPKEGPLPVVVAMGGEFRPGMSFYDYLISIGVSEKDARIYLPCPIEEELLERGYALAFCKVTDLCPDKNGYDAKESPLAAAYPGYDWRAVAMWSFGLQRAADWLLGCGWADGDRLISMGGSRGGKVAMHAAAYDERFAACVAAISGCGGAGNFRYLGGRMGRGLGQIESVGSITSKGGLGYFFADRLADFGRRNGWYEPGDECYLPFDLHTLRSLVAPRAIISIDGLDDVWCGAFGTQLSFHASQPVFNFLGADGKNAMLFREGGHYISEADWREALAFCDNALCGMNVPHSYVTKCFHNVHRIYFTDYFDYE